MRSPERRTMPHSVNRYIFINNILINLCTINIIVVSGHLWHIPSPGPSHSIQGVCDLSAMKFTEE
jgi:hypothetical protein